MGRTRVGQRSFDLGFNVRQACCRICSYRIARRQISIVQWLRPEKYPLHDPLRKLKVLQDQYIAGLVAFDWGATVHMLEPTTFAIRCGGVVPFLPYGARWVDRSDQ